MIDPSAQDKHQAQILSLEEKAKADASADLRDALAKLARAAVAGWIDAFGSLDAKATDTEALGRLVATLKGHLADAPTEVAPILTRAVKDAQELGAKQAISQLDKPVKAPKVAVSKQASEAIDAVAPKVGEKLAAAASILDGLSDNAEWDDVQAAVGVAAQGVTAIDRAATWLVNDASNSAVQAVTAKAGIGTVFIGERDACLDCNGYIGLTSDDDGYDTPPIHPNCRCSLAPWSADWAPDDGSESYPEALQREADRSVLKGWSGSDSDAARVRAADALLKAGTDLPKSVKQQAASAVRKGTFGNARVS